MILGPPGCGKTTSLLGYFRGEVDCGVPARRIACVAFTRAAATEVRQRLGIGKDEGPWIRTIHSTAYRLLNLRPGLVMVDEHWREFAKLHSYTFSRLRMGDEEDGLRALPTRTTDDLLRYAHSWGRNRRLNVEGTLAKFPGEGLNAGAYRAFVDRVERFKEEHRLLDFSDMLELVLAAGLRPGVEVLFLDEAQDLSPLQIAVVRMWYEPCERVYVAGDDDQAVFTFQGADPGFLVDLAKEWPTEVLDQSHRVPAAVHALAERIIRRNLNRVPKAYRPLEQPGAVRWETREQTYDLLDGRVDTFVLARNRMSLRPYAYQLLERGVPYIVEGEGGPSPLSDALLMRAANVAIEIHAGRVGILGIDDLDALLRHVPTADGLVPRGAKSRVKDARKAGGEFDAQGFCREQGLAALFEAIRANGPLSVFTRLEARTRRYLAKLLEKHGGIPEPKIRLTSIHGSKGREADLVVVISDMSHSTYRDYLNGRSEAREAENRVFYVGVTRTKETLVLVTPRSRRHYDFPSLGNAARAWREQFEERAGVAEFDGGMSRVAAEAAAHASAPGRVGEILDA